MPIYLSMQGFLRIPDEKIDDKNYSIKLEKPDNLDDILNGITAIFLDDLKLNLYLMMIITADMTLMKL